MKGERTRTKQSGRSETENIGCKSREGKNAAHDVHSSQSADWNALGSSNVMLLLLLFLLFAFVG